MCGLCGKAGSGGRGQTGTGERAALEGEGRVLVGEGRGGWVQNGFSSYDFLKHPFLFFVNKIFYLFGNI